MGTVDDDFWYKLPDRPYRVGRDGSVWRFFRGRGGKNPRWKPLKVDKVGRVTLCVYNEPAEVRARKSISVTNEVRVQLYHQAQYNQCVTIIDLRALSVAQL